MIITRKWIEKYLDLSQISNQQISVALNSLGFEVEEEVDYTKFGGNKIVLGYIESVEVIPDTKLKKTITKIGPNKTATILSTANNIYAGNYVVVALPGAKLFNGIELQNRSIMGIVSEGMFCAYNELAFPNSILNEQEQSDIIIVKSAFRDLHDFLGESINSVIGLNDYAFDIDLTLNRSDALAGFQLIKELANYFNLEINKKESNIKFSKNTQKYNIEINKRVSGKVKTISYALMHLTEKIFEMNTKDQTWLKICKAVSSSNQYEDLANIATIITGQPFILLDADKVSDDFEISTRKIDDKEVCILKNENKLVNIIGLKTEKAFAVDSKTQRVLVVMLNFDQILMRNQMKLLNTSNVDLQRYSKPLSTHLYEQGLDALLFAFKKYGLVDFCENLVIVNQDEKKNNIFTISLNRVEQILGTSFSSEQITELFKALDIKVTYKKDEITFVIDPNRTDIYGEFDLCEEIARIYGYDNFEEKPLQLNLFHKSQNLQKKLLTKISDYLIGNGFNNTKTYSLTEKNSNKKWNIFNVKNIINVMSPLSVQRESYRTNISKSLVETIIFNAKNGNKNLKLFEVGDIFALNEFRQNNLCVAISGVVLHDPLLKVNIKANYLYLHSILSAVVSSYNLDPKHLNFKEKSNSIDEIHPFINSEIKFKNRNLGHIFRLNPVFEKNNKINETFIFEINLDLLNELSNKKPVINDISKFQKSYRDVSIEISKDMSYREVVNEVLIDIPNLIKYEIGDIYHSGELNELKKYALTIKFEFNNLDHQLTEKEITLSYQMIIDNLKTKGLVIR